MIRIVIFSGLVAASMAACAGDGMYVCSYNTHTAAVAAQANGIGGTSSGALTNASACTWFFDGVCNKSIRADSLGAFFSIPWPVSGNVNGATLSATNFVTEMAILPPAMKQTALGGVAMFGTPNTTFGANATCAAPQLVYFDVAACGQTNASTMSTTTNDQVNAANCHGGAGTCNGADDDSGLINSYWNGSAATVDMTPYNDAVNSGATADLSAVAWTDAANFQIVDLRFFSNNSCAAALTVATGGGTALKHTVSSYLPMFYSDVTANTNTVAGLCNAVAIGVSYKLQCDRSTGTITHTGYPTDPDTDCTGTPGANDTTTWAPNATELTTTAWSTGNTGCFAWKGASNLWVQLWSTANTPLKINTNTNLATICAATAAPTAAPASGAAAVGTAAAVAAGAAALIL